MTSLRRTVLPSGLRIVTEQVPGVRSASVGAWVGVGSRHETAELHGASHFLEHLLFKGTGSRSAWDISVELDAVGGEANAFTTRDHTCFHARVLDRDVGLAIDVLGDMVTDPLLTPGDVDAEREVLLDEIAMHEDDPEDLVHDVFAGAAWGGTPLGRPVAGSQASVRALDHEQVRRFHRQHYRAPGTVVAVAGNVDHDQVVAQVRRAFDRNCFLAGDRGPLRPSPGRRARPVRPGEHRVTRDLEQVNLLLGTAGLTRHDERRYALGVLDTVLGGGTSSRLFQHVRERRGLAYSVYSFDDRYADAGLVGVAVGCLPERYDEVLSVVREQLADVASSGIDAEELARGKAQLRAALVLGLEDTTARMARLGRGELLHGEVLDIDEVMARIEAVDLTDVRDLAAEVFSRPEVLAVVGPGR